MLKHRRFCAGVLMLFMVLSVNTVSHANTTSCSLNGAKQTDATFVNSAGYYVTLSMKCTAGSAYGTMAVIRGRETYPAYADNAGTWLMYPALKCAIGKSNTTKRNIHEYANNHGNANMANLFSVRLYGNHCDNQKRGCYGTAKGVSS